MTRKAFEQLPTDYREFKGVSSGELGYGEEAVNANFYEHIAENGQRIGVYETQPISLQDSRFARTIIMPAQHDYRIEPGWMTRADIIASSAHARVVLVDMPGTTGLMEAGEDNSWATYDTVEPLSGAKQTPIQLLKALKGDFRDHAKVQLEAVAGTVGLDPKDDIVLFGESMGAQLAADMLAICEEQNLNVSQVILYELVNSHKGHKPALPLQLMKVLPTVENDRRTHYIEENTLIGHPSTAFEMNEKYPFQATLDKARKQLSQQAIAAGVNGLGLAHGVSTRLQKTLLPIYPDKRPEFTLVRGRESLATTHEGYADLGEVLNHIGIQPRIFEVHDATADPYPIGHAHTFSLARLRQISEVIL